MHLLKRLQHKSLAERSMFVIIAIGTLLRLILIYFNWPITNSDEGNMGLVALHIAYQGDHPTFFYGLPYMGPLEGYVAAPLFHLFGASLFTLRLALLPFYIGFLLSMFYLIRYLYSEKFALATVVLLSLGSADVIFLQMKAVGEYPEMLMFSALICLLTVSLALSSHRQQQEKWKRIFVYGFLGLIIGLALWVDFLIAPFVAMGGLLLFLFCRRELWHWQGLSLLVGIIVGAFPLLYYNLTAPIAQNSLNILLDIHHGGAGLMLMLHYTRLYQLAGAIMIALPAATGASSHCVVNAFPPFGPLNSANLPCIVFQGGWGFGYLLLWTIAAGIAVYGIWRYRRQLRSGFVKDAPDARFEERQEVIRQCGRLVLLVSAGITLLLYAISPSAAVYPDTSFRYLACLLLTLPALLWIVWRSLSTQRLSTKWYTATTFLLKIVLLLLVAMTFLVGTVRTFMDVPSAQATYQSEQALIQNLLKVGATRIYSEYWTCNRLTFDSQEKIICSVVNDQLQPGFDRYLPYRAIVHASPHPAYVFPTGSPQIQAIEHKFAPTHYKEYQFDGYVVFKLT
ncbi:MAG: hypothetical protein ABI396_01040 [Ktedonobacteraceae bacterium]